MRLPTAILLLAFSGRSVSQTTDYLPLATGNMWTYTYFASQWGAIGDLTESWNGTARYQIIDSAGNSDTIRWTMREIRDVQYSIDYYFPGPDTSFAIHDTATFELLEINSAAHRLLRLESLDAHWRSPFVMALDLPDTAVVNRYHGGASSDSIRILGEASSHVFSLSLLRYTGIAEVTTHLNHFVTGVAESTHHVLIRSALTTVDDRTGDHPGSHILLSTYPNPFNPSTTIAFSIPTQGRAHLSVVDLLGRQIATLHDGELRTGPHAFTWVASRLPSGAYFVVLRTDRQTNVCRTLLEK